jgi:hypothetical protein
MTVTVSVLTIAVALLAVLVVGLLRSHAEVLRRLHELGAGVYEEDLPDTRPLVPLTGPDIRTRDGVAPPREADTPARDVAGVTPAGEAVAVGVAGAPHSTLLAFLTSGCSTCAGFWAAFADGVAHELPAMGGEGTRLVVVTRGAESESPAEVHRLAPPGVLTIMSSQAFDDYAVPVNPYFILVDGPGGRVVGEGAAATWSQVAGLLDRAAADQAGLGVLDDPGDPDPEHAIHLGEGDLDDEDYDTYEDYEEEDDEYEDVVTAEIIDEPEWAQGEDPRRTSVDSRQRDALAEAELFVAGIGPGHPSLYPERLTDDPVMTEDG